MNTRLALGLLCSSLYLSTYSQNTSCVENIMCSDNKSIEVVGFDCDGPNQTCDVSFSLPSDAVAIMIEVISKGGNAAENAEITPDGESSFMIPLSDLPEIGSGHGDEAKVGRQCVFGDDMQGSYEVQFTGTSGSINSITFLIVRQAPPEEICGGSTATVAGGYVFHGETTLNFTIPATSIEDPKTIVVSIPLSDVDADGRLVIITASGGGKTDSQTFNTGGGSHYRNFTLTLDNIPGSTTNVAVNFCSPETGNSSISCSGEGDSFIIGSVVVNAPCDPAACGLLPIELTSFEGTSRAEDNLISWSTASEINASHFELEKKLVDYDRFEPITMLPARGSLSQEQQYSFTDREVQSESHLYRLKMVDLDGSYTHSQILNLKREMSSRIIINNPVEDLLRLSLDAKISEIQFFDSNGLMVLKRTFAGTSKMNINTIAWPAGVYVLRYHSGGKTRSERFIVQ